MTYSSVVGHRWPFSRPKDLVGEREEGRRTTSVPVVYCSLHVRGNFRVCGLEEKPLGSDGSRTKRGSRQRRHPKSKFQRQAYVLTQRTSFEVRAPPNPTRWQPRALFAEHGTQKDKSFVEAVI